MIKAHCGGLKSPIACESCGVFSLTPVDKIMKFGKRLGMYAKMHISTHAYDMTIFHLSSIL